jgi:hypothetical protein
MSEWRRRIVNVLVVLTLAIGAVAIVSGCKEE